MVKLNHHYSKLAGGYLFPEMERRVAAFRTKHPDAPIVDLGIGDVKEPLCPSIISALEKASRELGSPETFKGYGPAQGYPFLREAIAKGDYGSLGISPDEIFISDGAKNDIGNFQEIFAVENRVAIPDPTYPVYIDTNVMAGRTRLPLKTGGYGGIIYLPCTEENNFLPQLPNRPCDLIYLCSPSNPTGTAMTRETLQMWVRYAKENEAVILFDGAYEAYVRSPHAVRSIYEIPGAKEVAVEFRSFSKTAGFTGLRCSYCVVPHSLKIVESYQSFSLHALWKRRQETKFGGVAYPIQRAAAAIYSEQGKKEVKAFIDDILDRAKRLRDGLSALGYRVFGGTDAPYLWVKTPGKMSSWEFFDQLLEQHYLVSVPGSGFGTEGEGYVRFSAFSEASKMTEALNRLEMVAQ
ncbi:MAG: LL-diaminopimelate aminotransferase [Verrucomicrobiota bacterium]|nr:LL-diaminopimelate aminotransferase [Verrucomicrobiota bacterium]